jgi:hypothetical protein
VLRAYFQDLKLWGVFKRPKTNDRRTVTQEHQGVDQDTALVIAASPNSSGQLVVVQVWEPDTVPTWLQFRGREKALRLALNARREKKGPVCLVDDANSATVAGVSGSVLTLTATPPYAFQIGDHVLVRRLGVGLYSLVRVEAVGAWPAYTITVSAPLEAGGSDGAAHAYAIGDNVHKVEMAWTGMTFEQFPELNPGEHGDFYADDVPFTFRGLGLSSDPGPTIDLDA